MTCAGIVPTWNLTLWCLRAKGATVDYRTMTEPERKNLLASLRGNALESRPLYMDRDTSFLGSDGAAESRVIDAVRAVPCHY